MNNKNVYIISDDIFRGIFDTDGSILIVIDDHTKKNQLSYRLPFGLRIIYYFGQSISKRDLVFKVAEKFNAKVLEDKNGVRLRVNQSTDIGKKIRYFLSKNKPLNPGRRRDYLISEKIIEFLNEKVYLTKEDLIILIYLSYSNTRNMFNLAKKKPIKHWIDLIQSSKVELKEGKDKAKKILSFIEKEIAILERQLPSMKMSLDYIRGAHFGDGGLTIALTWKPNKYNRRRCVPEWTISGENVYYCKAFVNNIGGDINKSSKNCYKFRLYGITKCNNILYIFDTAIWMPKYKKEQFNKFKKSIKLLLDKKHFTKEGTIELVNLVYDLSEKGSRTYSKEQYLDWGISWLKNNNYI